MNHFEYDLVEVESYRPNSTSGLHGPIHIRPTHDQGEYKKTMHVSSSSHLKGYEVGTKFIIYAKITSRQGGKPYMYTNPSWNYKVIKKD